jgi:hypothetical protein
MKTKNYTLQLVIVAILCLFFSFIALSQDNQNGGNSILRKTPPKYIQKKPGNPAIFRGEILNDFQFMKSSASNLSFHADTIFRYSLNNGNEKIIKTQNNGMLLSSQTMIWMINKWVNKGIETYTYDVSGNLLTDRYQVWIDGAWSYGNRYTYTYDASGNCVNTLGQNFDGENWTNNSQSQYTWDESGNMLTALSQLWLDTDWMNNTYDVYTYDASGNYLTCLDQFWDGAVWMNNSMEVCTYDANGMILTDLYQSWDGELWQDSYLITYSYNSHGNRISSLEQMFDGFEWMNSYTDTMSYDESYNYISYTNWYSWDGFTWDPYSKGNFTYTQDGNTLSSIHQMWNMGDWENNLKVEYSYEYGQITADAYQWASILWLPGDSFFYVSLNDNGSIITFYRTENAAVEVVVNYSSGNVGIPDPAKEQSGSLIVSPNPATDFLILTPSKPMVNIENIQIFDMTGNEVHAGWAGKKVEIKSLPTGIYFLRIATSDGQLLTRKIVKQ